MLIKKLINFYTIESKIINYMLNNKLNNNNCFVNSL